MKAGDQIATDDDSHYSFPLFSTHNGEWHWSGDWHVYAVARFFDLDTIKNDPQGDPYQWPEAVSYATHSTQREPSYWGDSGDEGFFTDAATRSTDVVWTCCWGHNDTTIITSKPPWSPFYDPPFVP